MLKKEGIEKGIEQKEKEDAINFHKKGVDDQTIIEALNITEEKLKEYLNSENEEKSVID